MWSRWAACALVVSAGSAGCAGVNHRPVPPHAADVGPGIRYYQTSMYLLVYADGKGGLAHEVLELPDPTKKMIAEPHADLASLEMELKFTHGALSSSSEAGDGSKVPASILKAVGEFLPSLAGAKNALPPAGKPEGFPVPRLYKILVTGGRVRFVGVESSEQLQVVTTKAGD